LFIAFLWRFGNIYVLLSFMSKAKDHPPPGGARTPHALRSHHAAAEAAIAKRRRIDLGSKHGANIQNLSIKPRNKIRDWEGGGEGVTRAKDEQSRDPSQE
jgi:hypothetical protein